MRSSWGPVSFPSGRSGEKGVVGLEPGGWCRGYGLNLCGLAGAALALATAPAMLVAMLGPSVSAAMFGASESELAPSVSESLAGTCMLPVGRGAVEGASGSKTGFGDAGVSSLSCMAMSSSGRVGVTGCLRLRCPSSLSGVPLRLPWCRSALRLSSGVWLGASRGVGAGAAGEPVGLVPV